jgi:hypothetical protein
MNGEGLRARLEALNRGALPQHVAEAAVRAARSPASSGSPLRKANEAATANGAAPNRAWRGGVAPAIPGLIRRGEVVATAAGECLRIGLAVDELWPGGEELVRRRCSALTRDDSAWWRAIPERVAFFDLETCGLAGSAVFLAGLLWQLDGRLAVEMFLARDYSEESAVLAALWRRLAGIETLVTFNGKSFDWPMVVDRSRRHLLGRGAVVAPPRHVDLLHLARRRWKRELPDCKLQTLEERVCGRRRADDVPGPLIPAAYQQYVRTRFEREIDQVLLHNAIDLVTMLDLALRLAGDAGQEQGA